MEIDKDFRAIVEADKAYWYLLKTPMEFLGFDDIEFDKYLFFRGTKVTHGDCIRQEREKEYSSFQRFTGKEFLNYLNKLIEENKSENSSGSDKKG